MHKFKEGMKVVVVENNRVRKGVIKALYTKDVAIVEFEDGNVEKVECYRLGMEEQAQEKKAADPVEKSEITITPEQFTKVCVNTVIRETEHMPLVITTSFLKFCAVLHKKLFVEGGND